jgi:hypothetical protein
MDAFRLVLIAFCLVGLSACDELLPETVAPRDGARPPVSAPTPPPKGERAERVPSVPARPQVNFGELGGSAAEVKQAIADLKTVGLWDALTKHLYRIDVKVRPGESGVPEDRHLADARFLRAEIARGTYDYPKGSYCWIRFFPAAMDEDLVRWNSYYDQGLTPDPPPTVRQFWGSILGHELSHCPQKGKETSPEEVALSWERRVLGALRAAGVE